MVIGVSAANKGKYRILSLVATRNKNLTKYNSYSAIVEKGQNDGDAINQLVQKAVKDFGRNP